MMSANGEERTDIVILVDEEGNEHDFALVDRFLVERKEYAVLVPVTYDEDEQEGDEIDFEEEAYIFRIDLDGEEETLVEVDDESEWSQVAAVWEERMETLELEDDDDLF
jgi:uncharacterized protein YrzB (UPF0473 family)